MHDFKEKAKKFFTNKKNILIIIILAFAILLRIYLLTLTINQPVWWDEGEYGSKAVSLIKGTPTSIETHREVLVSYLWAGFYAISGNELLWRVSQIIISSLFVIVTYLFAKSVVNKRVALVATAFVAANAVQLFFSVRLLLYIWGAFFAILALYLFYEGYEMKKGNKYLYATAITLAIGAFVHYSVFISAIIIFLYLILIKRLDFLRERAIINSIIIGAITLIVSMFVNYISTGFFHARFSQTTVLSESTLNLAQFSAYFKMFPHLFGGYWTPFIIIGMVLTLGFILVLDQIVKRKSELIQRNQLYIFLSFWVTLGFFVYMAVAGRTTVYDAYVIAIFPIAGIFAGITISKICDFLDKNYKSISKAFLIIIIIVGIFLQTNQALLLINGKTASFEELRPASIWLKENTPMDAIILTASKPQVNYYSEREIIHLSEMPREMDNAKSFLSENKISYVVISPYDPTKGLSFEFFQSNPETFKPIHGVSLKNQPNQVVVVIYEVQNL